MMPARALALLLAAAMAVGTPCARAAAPAGRNVTVVRQSDSGADLAGAELLLQAGLDRQSPRQNGLAALVAQVILDTPVSPGGVALEKTVAGGGGSIDYVVEPRHVRFYLQALPSSFVPSLAQFRAALAKPDFSDATLRAARASLDRKRARNQRLALSVGVDMLNRAFYKNSDAGLPPLGMPQTVAGFSAADAAAFYAAHYRRGDAVVSAVGKLSAVNDADFAGLVDGLPAGTSPTIAVRMAALPSNSQQLIAHRDVPVPWLVAQYPAPDLRSKDFGAMLILTAFMQRTLADVSEVPSIATPSAAQRGVGAYYNFDTHPANVIIYVDGGLGDPTRTFATALTVVNVLGHAKLAGDLNEMRAFAAGRFLESTQSLQDRAWLAGVFAATGTNGDPLASIVKAIDSTNATDLQRVALHYLGSPTIALVLPRSQPTVQNPTP